MEVPSFSSNELLLDSSYKGLSGQVSVISGVKSRRWEKNVNINLGSCSQRLEETRRTENPQGCDIVLH